MFENDADAEGKREEETEDQEEQIPSVSAEDSDPSSGVCPVCHETFTQFYNQTTEEWHFKNVIKVDNVNYHPICHQDQVDQVSLHRYA